MDSALAEIIEEARRSLVIDPRTEKEVADELWGESDEEIYGTGRKS